MNSAISISGLNKIYSGTKKISPKEALIDINLEIQEGSFFGLLGPNGAGKSTIINILAGITNKTNGKIVISGVDIDEDPRGARYGIGVVPQEVVIDPFFSVYETLEYFAGYYGVPKEKRRTQEIIDVLHLADKANANSRRLSGGMKRRLLIAKAMVHSPPILVLDEPTAGVDVELRTQLWKYIRELNRNGTTILLTTHYLEEAEELCDQIAIINHGKIIANDNKDLLMNILDQKELTLRMKEPLDKVPEKLLSFKPTLEDPQTLVLNYRKGETPVNELLDIVNEEGIKICDLSTEEPDLEDIFRHLVNKS